MKEKAPGKRYGYVGAWLGGILGDWDAVGGPAKSGADSASPLSDTRRSARDIELVVQDDAGSRTLVGYLEQSATLNQIPGIVGFAATTPEGSLIAEDQKLQPGSKLTLKRRPAVEPRNLRSDKGVFEAAAQRASAKDRAAQLLILALVQPASAPNLHPPIERLQQILLTALGALVDCGRPDIASDIEDLPLGFGTEWEGRIEPLSRCGFAIVAAYHSRRALANIQAGGDAMEILADALVAMEAHGNMQLSAYEGAIARNDSLEHSKKKRESRVKSAWEALRKAHPAVGKLEIDRLTAEALQSEGVEIEPRTVRGIMRPPKQRTKDWQK